MATFICKLLVSMSHHVAHLSASLLPSLLPDFQGTISSYDLHSKVQSWTTASGAHAPQLALSHSVF